MTKKNFIKIAEILHYYSDFPSVNADFDHGARFAATRIARELSMIFEAENPRFDVEKFLKACGAE